MDVHQAIRVAEQQLPGTAAAERETDPRWQAIIQVGRFIESEPEPVWQFVQRWGADEDEDLRTAVATCLLEHLLETNFARFFPRIQAAVRSNPMFADTFQRCWKLGDSELPDNSDLFDELMVEARRLTG